jgi:hypothetical protein
MVEHPLVFEAHAIARRALQPPLSIERGAPLLYAVTVNNALQVTVGAAVTRRRAGCSNPPAPAAASCSGASAIASATRRTAPIKTMTNPHRRIILNTRADRHYFPADDENAMDAPAINL